MKSGKDASCFACKVLLDTWQNIIGCFAGHCRQPVVSSGLFSLVIYIIWCTPFLPFTSRPKMCSLYKLVSQHFRKNLQEIFEKSPCNVCCCLKSAYFCTRFRERKRRSLEVSKEKLAGKFGWNGENSLSLHPLSEKKEEGI